MSSSPRNPENAAPATLVSPAQESLAVVSPIPDSDSNATDVVSASNNSSSTSTTIPSHPGPVDPATVADPRPGAAAAAAPPPQQQCNQSPPVSAPVPGPAQALPQDTPPAQPAAPPPAPTTTTTTATTSVTAAVTQLPSQQDVSSHADPNNKKPRGPAALPRQSGPSLLTQALASARGIPSRTHSHNDQTSSSQLTTRSLPSPTADTIPFDHPPSSAGLDPLAIDHRHVRSLDPHGAAIAPRSAPQPGFIASPVDLSAVTTGPSSTADSTTVDDMEIMSSPAYDMATFQGIRAMLLDHRDFLKGSKSRGRGSSLERVDRESKVQDGLRKNRAHSHSSSPEGSLTSSIAQLDQKLQDDTDTADFRPKKLEQRFSLGPEKIWSIGSSEAIDGQEDGQVEKSVHEAMIGAEPNARSRKASYSLRFFREGLPKDDKTRKKDTRSTNAREKLSPSQEAQANLSADIAIEDFAAKAVSTNPTPSPRILDKRDWVPKQLERVKTFPLQTPQDGETPILTDSPTQDYFGLRKVNGDIFHKVDSDGAKQAGGEQIASEGDTSPTAVEHSRQNEVRRPSESSEHGESHEEGDESSEEKISSAVFVPHPGLEEAAERERDVVKPRQTPGARTASRAEDFHPWLVKADEPEPEAEASLDQPPDTPSHKAKPKRLPGAPNVALREVQPGNIDDLAVDDEPEPSTPRHTTTYVDDHAHHHAAEEEEPLEAIELIPYKHQVGGHTTLWRFSKRAVCKQLNNRENEFYEKVEQHHRDLLTFLPRYIGVLNVTFHKQPRRKSTHKREDAGLLDRKLTGENGGSADGKTASNGAAPASSNGASQSTQEHRRIISQSLASGPVPIPTVTFDDNWHILPRNLLQPTPPPTNLPTRGRSTSSSGLADLQQSKTTSPARPSLDDRHANSWGATTVNKRLRNEVFNDAFLKQPIPIHKHRRPHQKSMVLRKQPTLRSTNSVPELGRRQESLAQEGHAPHKPSPLRPNSTSPPTSAMAIERPNQGGLEPADAEDSDVKDVTGTSAPEPETLADKVIAQKKKRRYSGTGLRRKPRTVTESRGNLKYWEEADDAGYRGEDEGQSGQSVTTSQVNSPMIEPPTPSGVHSIGGAAKELSLLPMAATDAQPEVPKEAEHSTYASTAPSEVPSPTQEFRKIPRPVNPKEAQTQRNSRVEYFLLLEDLTAGMKRPCIMDLKMGTRQYGVEATPKKQKSQQGKCARTTSRELGVRVCGLQVWDVKSQSYVFKDKYFGRDLKAGQEFQDALTRFLYDGVDYSSILRHIPTILLKLDKLESIVRKLDGYRFYAASLLMFYDGDTSSEGNEYDTVVDDSTTDFATDTEETSAMREKRKRKNKRDIDFKIADFANSLTQGDLAEGKPCPPQHPNEPDRGFVRGLRTLRKYFLKIQRDIRADMGLDSHGRNSRTDMDMDVELDHMSDEEGSVSE
ncbi:putative inositol polyphosphate kinase [Colletotrichum orbiculare MAFF 240422]|uniref:Kinase n=1 Tax=Colletotrichum orbiculare (strain 104-T / ATCC 96160 / CBS 514.97 / LARS 414 / MAFF 240422) TaxID=1213857 RepID=A0A484FJ35_COLOR|nr:putative inositol polyphosphate kinase [Colletotrichum orbiculare MAFF 240422]